MPAGGGRDHRGFSMMFYYFTVCVFCFPNEGFKHVGNKSAVQGLAAAFKLWALCLRELPREDAGAQAPACTIDARPHPVLRTWVSGQPTASGTVTDDRSMTCTLVRVWRPWWKGGGPGNSLAPRPPIPIACSPCLPNGQ